MGEVSDSATEEKPPTGDIKIRTSEPINRKSLLVLVAVNADQL
ncbi:hypothetical protein [Levilactobacillus brevis]|uniref:Uncharacterized protein n=1 Tax=Levilactobacillus brevis KB290 TaxID=1001583 RepID=M5AF42_LEVBR|nr:hypothetical protein [Levilactobacillus brevis]KIO96268.1 hypothetical protein N624_2382 [Levilactobacillus brevis]BAN07463.1 hypothetical protein LVISKB_1828 [Levilactobacillus brevis KB290]